MTQYEQNQYQNEEEVSYQIKIIPGNNPEEAFHIDQRHVLFEISEYLKIVMNVMDD